MRGVVLTMSSSWSSFSGLSDFSQISIPIWRTSLGSVISIHSIKPSLLRGFLLVYLKFLNFLVFAEFGELWSFGCVDNFFSGVNLSFGGLVVAFGGSDGRSCFWSLSSPVFFSWESLVGLGALDVCLAAVSGREARIWAVQVVFLLGRVVAASSRDHLRGLEDSLEVSQVVWGVVDQICEPSIGQIWRNTEDMSQNDGLFFA